MNGNATEPLNRLERWGLVGFVILLAAIGGMVEYRSAFLTRRMGDLDVFLRAAWAVRNGEDLYAITSDNDWHYIYPPLYAILMTPLADPPRGADTTGYLPYPVLVAICFLLNVGFLFLGVHALASALEASADDAALRGQPPFCRRWWWLRMIPILVCILPIGHTLMRGQVNTLVLAALCGTLAGWIRGRSFTGGLWLALAICIKVIPAFLLVFPLWKRDWRALAGCLVGVIVGLGIIPLLTFGPERTVAHYQTYGRVFFAPILQLNEDDSRHMEITGGVNATESVGVRNALHNWMHPDIFTRPKDQTTAGKVAYLLLGFAMTLATLLPRSATPLQRALTAGALVVLMTIFSPVCHSHYLLFAVPIVMALLANAWQHETSVALPWHLPLLFVIFFATMAIAYLPGLEILKDRCASLFAILPFWALTLMRRSETPASASVSLPVADLPRAA